SQAKGTGRIDRAPTEVIYRLGFTRAANVTWNDVLRSSVLEIATNPGSQVCTACRQYSSLPGWLQSYDAESSAVLENGHRNSGLWGYPRCVGLRRPMGVFISVGGSVVGSISI